MKKIWNWILGLFGSAWFKALLKLVSNKVKEILLQVGEEALKKIKAKIAEVAGMNISNTQKLKIVFDYAKSLVPALPDSAINLLIETLVQELKSKAV